MHQTLLQYLLDSPYAWVVLLTFGGIIGWYGYRLWNSITELCGQIDKIDAQLAERCRLEDCDKLRQITDLLKELSLQVETLVHAMKEERLELIALIRTALSRGSGDDPRA